MRGLHAKTSGVTFDFGAAGIRACQFRQRGSAPRICDTLRFTLRTPETDTAPAAPQVDPTQVARLIGQGCFQGRDVTVVLSAPEVQFFPLRLPNQMLAQSPGRIQEALKWEIGQQARAAGEELEVRYWLLPHGHGQQPNVLAAALPTTRAVEWFDALARENLVLRRIDVSPCALVQLGCRLWTPGEHELWGVLDLGLRHSTLTVVVGRIPTYIRALSVCAHQWTQRIASAFEVTLPVAEQLKREHAPHREQRAQTASESTARGDLAGALTGILHEGLHALAQEVGRCFSYVMQAYPEHGVRGLMLAGGGADLGGLRETLADELGISVVPLTTTGDPQPTWQQPLPDSEVVPAAAAAFGGALLDLEAA
jgi:Tfp pilus assembly PilM family ATPase